MVDDFNGVDEDDYDDNDNDVFTFVVLRRNICVLNNSFYWIHLHFNVSTKSDQIIQLYSNLEKRNANNQLDMLPSQTAYPAGFETSTPGRPQAT